MAAPTFANFSFEDPVVVDPLYELPPGWSSTGGGSGLSTRRGGGEQFVYIYSIAGYQLTQTLAFAAGTYKVTFRWRPSVTADSFWEFRVDGTPVWSSSNASHLAWYSVETAPFTVAAGPRTLGLYCVTPNSTRMQFDDFIVVESGPATVPGRLLCFEPGAVGLIG